jgi:hypothetical protein
MAKKREVVGLLLWGWEYKVRLSDLKLRIFVSLEVNVVRVGNKRSPTRLKRLSKGYDDLGI